ncbi:MAG: DUF4234 domain-containing protein [Eubacterium sp.]
MVKKRSIGLAVLLYFVTLGIYPLVVLCISGSQVNKICEGDGKRQMHYLLAVLLGFVTLGIYPVVWCCKAMNRLQDNAYRYGTTVHPPNSGSSFVLWTYLGSFIAVGPIVAFCKFLGNMNAFADIAGYIQPLPYTPNQIERIAIAENQKVLPPIPGRMNQVQQPVQPQTPPYQQQGTPIPQQNPNPPCINPDPIPPTRPAHGYQPQNRQGSLYCTGGMYKDFSFPIQDNEEMTIGTNPQFCNIVLNCDAKYVSSKHCTVKYNAQNDNFIVVDYSTNGTFKDDDSQLQPNCPTVLLKGDVIYLGDRTNSFRFV